MSHAMLFSRMLRKKTVLAALQQQIVTTAVSGEKSGVPRSTSEINYDEKMIQPVKYVMQLPGKKMMAELANSLNYWLKVPTDKLLLVQSINRDFYRSTVLIDDIEDNSILRRGIPVAYSIYGIPSTISAANYILLTGLKRLQCLNHPEVLSVCTEHLFNWFWGQTLEIYWRDNYICPSEEEYLEMNKRRMYGFFMLEIGLMKLLSDNKADFTHLTRTMALYIQIRNDYMSLCLQQYSKDKGYFDDITEGKFSFPIIHAIKSRPDDNQVIHILRQRTRDLELKKYCVALLEKFGSFSYTRKTLEKLDAEIRAEVAKHGGNPQLQALLDELLNWKRTEEKDPEQ